jgi:hypothetical protein
MILAPLNGVADRQPPRHEALPMYPACVREPREV